MGAISSALLAQEASVEKTKFKGFNIKKFNFNTKNLRYYGCPNRREVTQLYEAGKLPGRIESKYSK